MSLAVVIWIAASPWQRRSRCQRSTRCRPEPAARFQSIERRFVWQTLTAVIIVGLSGLYMTWRLDLWGLIPDHDVLVDARHGLRVAAVRLRPLHRRIAEPFILHRRFRCLATEHPVSPSRGYIAWSYRVRRRDDPGRGCGKS